MSDEQFPRDAIFISFGRFQAGAFGKLAIAAFVILIIGMIGARALGIW
jgi:hypothetical protein